MFLLFLLLNKDIRYLQSNGRMGKTRKINWKYTS